MTAAGFQPGAGVNAGAGGVVAEGARRWWLSPWVPLACSVAVHGLLLAGVTMSFRSWSVEAPASAGSGGIVVELAPMKTATAGPAPVRVPEAAADVPAAPTVPTPRAAEAAGPGAGGPDGGVLTRPVVERGGGAAGLASSPGGALAGALAGGDASSIGVAFAGLSATPTRSVVYVVDSSGPMVTTLPQVLALLTRSVGDLRPTQRFGVVLFREVPGEPGAEVFSPKLLDATARNRGRLKDWLVSVRARGRSNPLAGLRAALALKPQVVFLLTRSIERSQGGQWEQGEEVILAELESLNPVDPATGRRATIIKTIQFLNDDPTGIMAAIAERHGKPGARGAEETAAAEAGYRVLRREELPE